MNKVVIEDEYNGKKKTHLFKHLGNLEPIGEIHASEYSHEDFLRNHLSGNKPLVIREALSIFDTGTSYKHWSVEYLTQKCGHNKVHVRRNTNANEYKTGQAYFAEEVEFRSYVNDLLANNQKSQNSYMAVQNLRKAFPQIFEELKPAPFVEKLHGGPFLWISRAGNYLNKYFGDLSLVQDPLLKRSLRILSHGS